MSGEIAATPAFLGANPHKVQKGPFAGLRVLGAEEDLARELIGSLDANQMERVAIATEAPSDIILGPGRKLEPGRLRRTRKLRRRRLPGSVCGERTVGGH